MCLLQQGLMQDLQTWDEVVDSSFGCSHVGCGWEGVVGGLAHVHVVVRVQLNAILLGEGSDDLVGVHVGRGTRTGLENIDWELSIVLAGGDILASSDDSVGDFAVQCTGILVDLCTCSLQKTHCADLRRLQATAGDWEVLNCTLGLCAPQCVLRNLYFAHRVMFDAVFSHEIHLLLERINLLNWNAPSRHVSRYWVFEALRLQMANFRLARPDIGCGACLPA